MGLTIEGNGRPHAENVNHPGDVYIYFDGGFYVWSIQQPDFAVWYCGDMFLFSNKRKPGENVAEFNAWARSFPEPAGKESHCEPHAHHE